MKRVLILLILVLILTGCSLFKPTCEELCQSKEFSSSTCTRTGSTSVEAVQNPCKDVDGVSFKDKTSDCNYGVIGAWDVCCCH